MTIIDVTRALAAAAALVNSIIACADERECWQRVCARQQAAALIAAHSCSRGSPSPSAAAAAAALRWLLAVGGRLSFPPITHAFARARSPAHRRARARARAYRALSARASDYVQ